MRVVAKKALREFWEKYPDAEQPLKAWFRFASSASWETPAQIKAQFGKASLLRRSRVVFNIAGNKYRLVVFVRYDLQKIYVRFIGTHQQYDQIDAEEV